MRLELTGRHVEISAALRRLVDTRLKKLERLLNDSTISTQVVLTREKNSLQADIMLHARGEKFLHGVGSAEAWGPSLAQAVDKIAQQARKMKGKFQERKRQGRRIETAAPKAARQTAAPSKPRARERTPVAFRTVRQTVERMSVTDAMRSLGAQSDNLVVFRDGKDASISVLYRGQDGELTLVETES